MTGQPPGAWICGFLDVEIWPCPEGPAAPILDVTISSISEADKTGHVVDPVGVLFLPRERSQRVDGTPVRRHWSDGAAIRFSRLVNEIHGFEDLTLVEVRQTGARVDSQRLRELRNGDGAGGLWVEEIAAVGELCPVFSILRVEIGGITELLEGFAEVAFNHQGASLSELDLGIEQIGFDAERLGGGGGSLLVRAVPFLDKGLPSIGIGEIAIGAGAGEKDPSGILCEIRGIRPRGEPLREFKKPLVGLSTETVGVEPQQIEWISAPEVEHHLHEIVGVRRGCRGASVP